MKIQKKQLQAAITIALTLTIAATLLTAVPITLGQVAPKIATTAMVKMTPPISGINQNVLIEGVITPRPIGYSQDHSLSKKDVYHDLTFVIVRPDKTKENVVMDSDDRSEAWFWYNCTQLGTYNVTLTWAGDAQHKAATIEASVYGQPNFWTVQAAPVQFPSKLDMKAFLSTTPKKIGTGQSIFIVGWLSPIRELWRGIYYDVTFTITRPDGTTDTKVMDTDDAATASFGYPCNQAGTWKVKMSFAGDKFHNSVESAVTTWTVEDGYVAPTIPQEPLPTGQWQWPVSAEYEEWYQISGAWPQAKYNMSSCNFNPYSKAPNTPHIIWRKQMDRAGLMGGELGYFDWSPTFPSIVAAQGRLYYTQAETVSGGGGTSTATHPVLYCLDQFTGELIYRRDLPGSGSGGTPVIQMAQRYKSDPQLGAQEISAFNIWLTSGGVWQINPFTGQTTYYSSSLPGGTYHDDAIYMNDYPVAGNWSKWDTNTRTIVYTKIKPLSGDGTYKDVMPSMFWNDLGAQEFTPTGGVPYFRKYWSWNLTTGDVIAVSADMGLSSGVGSSFLIADGMTFHQFDDMRTRAIDLYTGKIVWTSDPMEYPWGDFTSYTASYSWGPTGGGGNGQIYLASFDGNLYAYDIQTGKLNWKAFTTNNTEAAQGYFTPWSQAIIADNKVYFSVGEHTPPQPLPRGGQLYCVDANTGERIWTLDGFYGGGRSATSHAGASSGILWYPNVYDGCVYAFGKGPTVVTVSVSQSPIANGGSTVIQGTVTDQSSGAMGTPAISDADQAQWMQYLYMNKPIPTNATGVTVNLMAELSNGTVIDVTHVTSDIMGHYEYMWTPPAADTYKILATFEGSDSYYASSAQTALGVTAAAPTPAPPAAAPDNTPIFIGIIAAAVAIIIAVTIVGVLLLRKRP
jgi:outer membrane protein assembly factor BamB